MTVVAWNVDTVTAEIIKWGHYQLWNLLQCPYGDIRVAVEIEGTESKVTFEGPGAGNPENKERILEIYERMKMLARERMAFLDTRRPV